MKRVLVGISLALLTLVVLLALAIALVPTRWLADRIELLVQTSTGYAVAISVLELDLLSLHPSVRIFDVDVDGHELAALVRNADLNVEVALLPLFRGQLLIERVQLANATVLARRDKDGRSTWAAAPVEQRAESESEESFPALPAIEQLLVENVTLRLEDAVSGREASLAAAARGSTLDRGQPLILDLAGDIDNVEANVSLAIISPTETLLPGAGIEIDLTATFGAITATLDGSIGDVAAFREVDLDLTVEAPDLVAIETLLASELQGLAPLRFSGTVTREGSELILRRFDLTTSPFVVGGDVRFDRESLPPTLYANLIVSQLDVDALLATFGVKPDGVETRNQDPEGGAIAAKVRSGTRLLPDTPLPFDTLFNALQGAIDLDVDGISSNALPIEGIDARLELSPARLSLTIDELLAAGGNASGKLTFEPTEGGPLRVGDVDVLSATTAVELELAQIDMGQLLRKADLPEEAIDAGGRLGGKIKLWGEGASGAELAGTLDGGAFFLMSGGTVNAVFVELAGLDLFQSLGDVLVPGEEQVPIRCAYVDLHTEAGLVTINDLILDTDDTVFIGKGTVNLDSEELGLTLEPHPKDPSMLAASTAVEVGGTFAKPEISVDGSLAARAAAMVLLSQVAAPALALLPLIELGGADDSPFCSEIDGALD